MPHAPFRHVVNTLLYVLITGCRWCDVPKGEIWASKSAAHRWLMRWETDGTLESLLFPYTRNCSREGFNQLELRCCRRFFFPRSMGGGEGVKCGHKGKGILIHTLTDGDGMPKAYRTTPTNGSERDQVIPLLDSVKVKTNRPGRPDYVPLR